MAGTFKSDLMRTFKQLKESRAESVVEETETLYRRSIEDLCQKIKRYDRDRENMILDLSPINAGNGAVVPSDFSAEEMFNKDIELGINRRNAIIKLEIAVQRYNALFGPFENMAIIKKVMPEYVEPEIIND